MATTNVERLLTKLDGVCGLTPGKTWLLENIQHPPEVSGEYSVDELPRVLLAHLLNILLFSDLINRVPLGRQYAEEKAANGKKILLDHGALRTVRWQPQPLPSGVNAFSRILEPLGYELAAEYPLEKLSMCGFVFTHKDLPETISQFFVSELYPERFSEVFQQAVGRVINTATDPLTPASGALLEKLAKTGCLNMDETLLLIPNLLACFDRQHLAPRLEDYRILLDESAEMAWIATEGNAFNHATDRITDIDGFAARQHALGRPLKPAIEVAHNAQVKQTAYRAAQIQRPFTTPNGEIEQTVPGSFFEFIERGRQPDGSLDLRFDSRNAQGIFKMTNREPQNTA